MYIYMCVCVCVYIYERNGNPLQYFCLGNPMDKGTPWSLWGFKGIGRDLMTKQQQQQKKYIYIYIYIYIYALTF